MDFCEKDRMQIKNARSAAGIIGITAVAEYGLNILLFPFISRYSGIKAGSFEYEILNMLLYIIVFIPPFYVLSRLNGWKIKDLNGEGKPTAKICIMAVCLTVGWNLIASFLASFIEIGLNNIGWAESGNDYIAPVGIKAAVVMCISTAIIPPIAEELCYRGFFLNVCKKYMNIWASIILTAFSFWLAHGSITILPLAFGFGVIGGVMRTKYNSLLPSMCGHFVVNGTYIIINQAEYIMPDGKFYVFQGIFIALEIICLIIGIVMMLKTDLIKTVKDYINQSENTSSIIKGVLTSIPFWIMIGVSVYMTIRGLEAFV